MDSLFGISLTSILVGLLALLAAAFAVLIWIAWRNPLLVRMGLRNIVRRKAQTTLIVLGLMLSTLIISAAFATGDTVGFSLTNDIYESLGEVDFVIGADTFDDGAGGENDLLTQDFLDALRAGFAADGDIDGITGLMLKTLPVANLDRRLSEPGARFVGIDPATVGSFRGLRTPGGREISAAALGGNRAFITERLADGIDAGVGDRVTVFFENRPSEFEVVDVVRDTSVTEPGAGPGERFGGLVVDIETAREVLGTPDRVTFIAVSSRGDTRGSLALSDRVQDRLEAFIDAHPEARADIALTKDELVALGELVGSVFVTFFLVFGLFSIAAGVMLIFLIFIMLAAERRSEMGMARAIGMSRLHLTETFLAEGMAYNVGSAAVGALLGLGVAALLIFVLAQIASEFGLTISFHFNAQGFFIAYSLGVVLTFVTVAFSSYRAANLNIVRAIRDLPEPQGLRGEDRSLGGLLRAALGALWMVAWVALATVWAVAGFQVFLLGLAFYGLPFIAAGALGAWFVFGARRTARRGESGRARRAATLVGLIALGAVWATAGALLFGSGPARSVAWLVGGPLLVALYMIASSGTDRAQTLKRDGRLLAYIGWWLAFSAMALVTWVLLRSRARAARWRNAGGWALLMLVLGLLLIYLSGWASAEAVPAGGWFQGKAFAYTGGVTLGVLALAMLGVYFGAASRTAFTAAGLLLVWYWLLPLPFSLFADTGSDFDLDPIDGLFRVLGLPRRVAIDGNIEMFFVSGVSITASATLVVIFNADRLLAVVTALGRVLGGVAPAIKTAVAYPLAAKFRTAMTLAMFALVVFSLVVMATLNFNFSQLFLGDEASAGFDVVVDGNPSNRIPALRGALDEAGYDAGGRIAGVGTLIGAFPEVREDAAGDGEFHRYAVRGVDSAFLDLARFPFQFRAIGYGSDEAVMEALRNDPSTAVIDASRLRQEGPFGNQQGGAFQLSVTDGDLRDGPWQPIALTLRSPGSSEVLHLNVIAVLEPQITGVLPQLFAIFTARENVERALGGGEVDTFFVTASDTSKEATKTLADDIESTLLERGVQAESIRKLIDDAAAQSTAFQLLFEGFMGLGLIVGIAALGVIAFRTVVERRQQIGVLRAIGYTRRLIGLSFFLESSFIAVTGIVMGLVLGTALSFNLLTSAEFTDGADIDFQVPWLRIVVISAIAYGASALMTFIPARSASRVAVAEALRYE